MNHNHAYLVRLYTRLANYLVLNGAFVLGLIIRFDRDWLQVFGSNNYIALLLFINLSWVLISGLLRYYRTPRLNQKMSRRVLLFLQVALLHFLLILAFNGVIKTYYSRLFLIYFYTQFVLIMPLAEWIARLAIAWYQRQKGIANHMVFVGNGATMNELAEYFKRVSDEGSREVNVVDCYANEMLVQIQKLHAHRPVNELYCSSISIPQVELRELAAFCENNLIRVRLVLDHPRWETKPLELVTYDSIPVLNIPITPLDEQGNKMIKRAFDVVFFSFDCGYGIVLVVSHSGIVDKTDLSGSRYFQAASHWGRQS